MATTSQSSSTSLMTRPALELAGLIRAGDVTPRQLVEEALAGIERRADLNAFTFVDAEGALAAADAIEPGDSRPFAGVPIAIKELHAVAGQQLTMSSSLFREVRAESDSHAVRRLRQAGFIFVGRTNAPELGIGSITAPRLFGPARNPWNLERTPGGSSGGAAAAVAGGVLPICDAGDGGGSIRGPAASCGLVGLKPSRGRISVGPRGGDTSGTAGVVTRTVADTAHLLDILAGYEIGDLDWPPPPVEPFATTASREPAKLRIALTTISPFDTPVDPTCAEPAYLTAELLESLGHRLVEVLPPNWPDPVLFERLLLGSAGGVTAAVRAGARRQGREPRPDDVEPLTWAFYQRGLETGAADMVENANYTREYAKQLIRFLSSYDVLLTPTMGTPPLRAEGIDTSGPDPLGSFRDEVAFSAFTPLWNLTGLPAITLPLIHGADGLPRGIQLVGPPANEGMILSLATQLEMARPWADRLAPGV